MFELYEELTFIVNRLKERDADLVLAQAQIEDIVQRYPEAPGIAALRSALAHLEQGSRIAARGLIGTASLECRAVAARAKQAPPKKPSLAMGDAPTAIDQWTETGSGRVASIRKLRGPGAG